MGFAIKRRSAKSWIVTIPHHRNDLREEVDLIEEVARLRGYETIDPVSPARPIQFAESGELRAPKNRVKSFLAAMGFNEMIHYSFCAEAELHKLGDAWTKGAISLANPLSQETGFLRPTLILSLLGAAQYHHNRQMMDLRCFELRAVYSEGAGTIAERDKLAGLLSGQRQPVHWRGPNGAVDYYETKGVVEGLLGHLQIPSVKWSKISEGNPYFSLLHPRRSAMLLVGKETLGVVGELHPELEVRFELKAPIGLFELDWGTMMKVREGESQFSSFSAYPQIERDMALLVADSVQAADIAALIREQEPELIQEVRVFDVYRGPQVPEGQKSLAFSYKVGRTDRTLTDLEVQALQEKIIISLKKKLQAVIR